MAIIDRLFPPIGGFDPQLERITGKEDVDRVISENTQYPLGKGPMIEAYEKAKAEREKERQKRLDQ